MNTRTLIAAAALTFAAAGSAFAQEATIDTSFQFTQSTVSRTAVQAEAKRALAAGELSEMAQLNPQIEIDSMLSREAVRAATAKALKRGGVASVNAEAFSFA